MLVMIPRSTDTTVERPFVTGPRIIPGEGHFKHACIVSRLQRQSFLPGVAAAMYQLHLVIICNLGESGNGVIFTA